MLIKVTGDTRELSCVWLYPLIFIGLEIKTDKFYKYLLTR